MVTLRSQDGVSKDKGIEAEDPMEKRMSRLEKAAAELKKSTLDFQNTTSRQFSEIMAALNRSRDDELCDDRSPLDRYSPSSQKVKESGSEGLERALNDEELVETEVATELIGIEDGTVKREANTEVISAIVKEESIPQFLMVTEADSTCVQHTNVILQQVSISPLEHSLNFCKANLDVMGNCQYAMGKTHQIWSDSNFGCVKDDACQVFDVIHMGTKVLPREHKKRFHKSWRFKFKQQRGKLRSAHPLIHRGNVMYKSLCSSAKVALMKKNKFSITWPMLKDDCFIEDDQVSHETLPLGLLIRSKFKKSKFRKFKFRKEKIDQQLGCDLMVTYLENHTTWTSRFDEEDQRNLQLRTENSLSRRWIQEDQRNLHHVLVTVYEQIKMVKEWQHQISWVLQQVMRSKKIRLSKRWWFKYRFNEEDGSLQSRAGHSLSRREILTFISQAKALLFESKDWREKQIPTLKFLKQINISHYRWIQEVFAVIGFLLKRHLQLTFNSEEPKLAGQKRNHGLLIRLHSKQKQRKCPKSWMFKFKTGSKLAGTSHLKRYEESGLHKSEESERRANSFCFLFVSAFYVEQC